jgi:hypothetical protein
MKPWLTIRQQKRSLNRPFRLPTDVTRIRTSCAVYILARTSNIVRPTRPCREMQSYLTAPSVSRSQAQPTGPPSKRASIIIDLAIVGVSVEIVMPRHDGDSIRLDWPFRWR